MENSFGSIISSAKSILILLPNNPTLDEVAAGLSLSLVLPQDSNVSCETPMLVEFNRLVGVNKIRKDLGNKNLSVKFVGYKADDIEKVSYDIEQGEFKLTVVPKLGMNAPKVDQVSLSYSGVSADLIVLIGGDDKDSFPALNQKDLQTAKKLHFGVRALDNIEVIEFARPASAVSEVLAHLIKESGLVQSFDPDTATNLLTGIEEASQSFTHPYVNADTFSLVSELMKSGGRRSTVERVRPEQFPMGAIPGVTPLPEDSTDPEGIEVENAPQSWFEKPQIYKGTSVS
ncbi:hypothetical protein KW795_01710 [Candidatus Microgenomates bacterium]|nr:hypothetical protein [Candidatus Microgenomates bacterium]